MTQFIARLLSFLPGLLFLSVAYTWVTNPSKAANDLDMVYLEGLGRSTQIGDFSAFFISVSLFCIIGSIFKNTSFLFSAIIILSHFPLTLPNESPLTPKETSYAEMGKPET